MRHRRLHSLQVDSVTTALATWSTFMSRYNILRNDPPKLW